MVQRMVDGPGGKTGSVSILHGYENIKIAFIGNNKKIIAIVL